MRPSAPIPMTYEMLTMLLTRVGTKRWKEENPFLHFAPRAQATFATFDGDGDKS